MAKEETQQPHKESYLDELPPARPHIHETRRFPEGFLWGSATSSHQVEGGQDNDWTEWEKIEGHILDGSLSGDACDHWNRYEEDFDLLQSLGQNAYRLSIEWSRIEPEEGRWDMDAVVHYRRMLESLKRRNIRIMLTAWHFTLPKWFQERGGWLDKGSVERFRRYIDFLAAEYGDLVDIWITINEPMVYLSQSYSIGLWPPGISGKYATMKVLSRLSLAHRGAYKAIHHRVDSGERQAMVGIAKNVVTFEPYRKQSLMDGLFIWFADRLFNRQFFLWTKGTHDFIGINYYFHYRVKYVPNKLAQFFHEVHTENREVSDLGWEINPEGIFEAVLTMQRYKLPMYITENGIASADDSKRPRALVATLKELYHAIQSGADVRGYFHWSFMDNFEWEKGYGGRFGLVAVDFKTQKRTPRRSAYVYAEICKENGLAHRLLRFMGHSVRW
ncbi:glycoside hydrolase family 1 protein [Patescibacteria group bacterium]